ncbi:DUF397 domain-containing protein [Streptomyces sp. ST2-7A]|uniref:DUF397 domain-containing protein n=1 Tax=Streptomyces sp. ST2-7A TaxID=2907214 RepID=UPI0035ABAA7D
MTWQKSSFSTNGAECLEIRHSPTGIQFRESVSPENLHTVDPARLRSLIHYLKCSVEEHK